MQDLPLALAERLADAAFTVGAAQGLARLSVVVTDAGGAIRVAMRSDGQAPFPLDIAHAKARSALGFGRSTLKLAAAFADNPSSTVGIASATGGDRFVPIGGGVVVTDDAGRVLGAAAVAGGAPELDDVVVRAAVQAVGLQALG